MMDMSPLPHKAPFVGQVEIHSPTPFQSPGDEMLLESPAARQPTLDPPKPLVSE